jgi:hypothetical protein
MPPSWGTYALAVTYMYDTRASSTPRDFTPSLRQRSEKERRDGGTTICGTTVRNERAVARQLWRRYYDDDGDYHDAWGFGARELPIRGDGLQMQVRMIYIDGCVDVEYIFFSLAQLDLASCLALYSRLLSKTDPSDLPLSATRIQHF